MGRGFKGLFSEDFISAFNPDLSGLSAMFLLVYPIYLFQLNLIPLLIILAFPVRKSGHKICKASKCNPGLPFFLSLESSNP